MRSRLILSNSSDVVEMSDDGIARREQKPEKDLGEAEATVKAKADLM